MPFAGLSSSSVMRRAVAVTVSNVPTSIHSLAVLISFSCHIDLVRRPKLLAHNRRAFERRFSLADHIKVTGAHLDNGMLHVDLMHKVPEAAKLRKIAIGTSIQPVQPVVTEQKAA
jgi:hypothetical protein